MHNCERHGDKEALSFCHNCGKFFCKECLTEGKEFYYCQKPECQKKMIEDDGLETKVSEEVMPQREANPNVDYDLLDVDLNLMDSSLLQSLLDNAEIDYYCTNTYFYGSHVEFYIRKDQMHEVEKILNNFHINPFDYSTKKDLED